MRARSGSTLSGSESCCQSWASPSGSCAARSIAISGTLSVRPGVLLSGAVTVLGWLGLSGRYSALLKGWVEGLLSSGLGSALVCLLLCAFGAVSTYKAARTQRIWFECQPENLLLDVADQPARCRTELWVSPSDAVTAQAPGYDPVKDTVENLSKRLDPSNSLAKLPLALAKKSPWECRLLDFKPDKTVFPDCGQPGNWQASRTCRVELTSTRDNFKAGSELMVRSVLPDQFAVAIQAVSDGCFGRAYPGKASDIDAMTLTPECMSPGGSWRADLVSCAATRSPDWTKTMRIQVRPPNVPEAPKELADVECKFKI